jgi:ABC-type antimicrobial peptide transport system permease subunit
MRCVGVVGDTRYRGLPDNPTPDPDIYLPLASRATPNISILLHTDVSPVSITRSVQDAIQSIDPLLAPYGTYAMAERVDAATAPQRFLSQLSTAFGIVALLLAIVGTYGVVAYQVLLAQRAIGIRLALGAMPRQVFTNVMGHTAKFVTVGLAGGAVLAWYGARAISEQLFRPPESYVPVIALVAGIVLIVACASAWLPARRAMKVDPISVLRAD